MWRFNLIPKRDLKNLVQTIILTILILLCLLVVVLSTGCKRAVGGAEPRTCEDYAPSRGRPCYSHEHKMVVEQGVVVCRCQQ